MNRSIEKLEGWRRFVPGTPTLIILGAIVIVVLLVMTRPSEVPEPRQERAWAVEVIGARPTTLNPTLELFGQVQSPQDSELSAGVEAVVVSMPVRDGDSVEQGEKLIVLDDRDALLELKQNEADLKEARAQRKFAGIRKSRSEKAFDKEQELLKINLDRSARAQQIFSEGLLSKADLDTTNENLARQQLAVNEAELAVEENSAKLIELDARIARIEALRDRAALDLERTRITAPFAGVISDLQVSEGDRVRVGDTLMRLQNPESIEIRAQVPSRLARSISEGLQEDATIVALVEVEDRNVTGKVLRVSGQTSAGSGGVDSFIGFDSRVTGLRLGSTVRLLLELPPESNVIPVPAEAIYGSNRLYKLNDSRMQMIEVERIGEREQADGRTEVLVRTPLLGKEDKIIVTKLANAADGLLVKQNMAAPQAEQTRLADEDATTTLGNSEPADN